MSRNTQMQDKTKCHHLEGIASRKLNDVPNFVAGRPSMSVSRITGANAQKWLLSLSGGESG
jgi:hypothetical protein